MTDYTAHLADHRAAPAPWWRYEFPNGRGAQVYPANHERHPYRFDVEYDGEDGMFVAPGLSTAEVEAKLAEVMALPAEVAA
ncbi:hypothetical protein [Dactylosporangium salmoneum]|uniref:Uncharacterized protein n=1 Tax=Dactylosporangium salmoneum TaxID=53361 RepID=A0ABN3GA70_9ACTN